jgi:hypothetical protein
MGVLVDQKTLLESLTKQLDTLASLFFWLLGLTLPMAFARMTRQDSVEVLGTEVKSRDAFSVAAFISLVAQVGILLSLTRLMALMGLLNNDSVVEGVSRLATHPWILSPFAFFGTTVLARVQSAIGYGLFFIVWGTGAVLAVGISAQRTNRANFLVAAMFTATGVAAFSMVWGVNVIVLRRLHEVSPDLYRGVSSTFMAKTFCLLAVPIALKAVNSAMVRWSRRT